MTSLVVTTSRKAAPEETAKAEVLAAKLGVPFVPRDGRSLASLTSLVPDAAALVVTRERLVLQAGEGEFFFHPGMARPRVRRLAEGEEDVMVRAMGLRAGQSVLDCTLGLGTDAVVASFVVGDAGRVVGIESVPAIAELVAEGMRAFTYPDEGLVAAMRRIEVLCGDYLQLLPAFPAGSFDVVYFDPMFRDPVQESSHMTPWRRLADDRPVSAEAVAQARRVARRKVVLKERRHSPVFSELGFHRVSGGRSSRVAFGVCDLDDASSAAAGDDVEGDIGL